MSTEANPQRSQVAKPANIPDNADSQSLAALNVFISKADSAHPCFQLAKKVKTSLNEVKRVNQRPDLDPQAKAMFETMAVDGASLYTCLSLAIRQPASTGQESLDQLAQHCDLWNRFATHTLRKLRTLDRR